MKRDSFSIKRIIILSSVTIIFLLLLWLSGEYRLAIRQRSASAYFNENPAALLWIIVVCGCGAIALLFDLIRLIIERDRLMAEAALEIRKVTNNLHAGVVNYFPDSRCTVAYASQGYYDLVGANREQLFERCQNSLLEMIAPKYHSFFLNKDAIEQKGYAEETIRMHDVNGKEYWMQVTLSKAVHSGKPAISAVFVDVTELKNAQDRLLLEQERYRIVTELSNEVIFEYDYASDELNLSEAFTTIYGKNRVIKNFMKDIGQFAKMIHPKDRKDSLEQITRTKRIGANDIQLRLQDVNEVYQWCRILYRVVCNENGEPIHAIGKISNISSYKAEIESLAHASKTDLMTGAYNKMSTKDIIDKTLKSNPDSNHMLLMVDIDEFKKINDNYGHQVGDEVIIYTVKKMCENYRDGEIIGRVGGDEFVIFISNVENKELLLEKAQNLRDLLKMPYEKDGQTVPVSASIGVSMFPSDGNCYEDLMFCADSALYEVKRSQKGNFAIFSKDKDGKEEDR